MSVPATVRKIATGSSKCVNQKVAQPRCPGKEMNHVQRCLIRPVTAGRFSVLTLLLLAVASCATTDNRSAKEPGQTEKQASASGINSPATVPEAIDILAALPSPVGLQLETDNESERQRLLDGLVLIALMDDETIDKLYDDAEEYIDLIQSQPIEPLKVGTGLIRCFC